MYIPFTLNFRDLGGIPTADNKSIPYGLYMRSGKLDKFSRKRCAKFCQQKNIGCIIDLRTPHEAEEFPDPIPEGIKYIQIPIISDELIGITHETGSDPMNVLKKLRHDPVKMRSMIPDMDALYKRIVTNKECKAYIEQVLAITQENAENGIGTLLHCTAGKDRTGITCIYLLRSLGVSDEEIMKDYLKTNRSAYIPTLVKCIGVYLLTRDKILTKYAYRCFLAQRDIFQIALDYSKE